MARNFLLEMFGEEYLVDSVKIIFFSSYVTGYQLANKNLFRTARPFLSIIVRTSYIL